MLPSLSTANQAAQWQAAYDAEQQRQAELEAEQAEQLAYVRLTCFIAGIVVAFFLGLLVAKFSPAPTALSAPSEDTFPAGTPRGLSGAAPYSY